MWIPETEEGIERALASRELREGAAFDGKRQIPDSRDLATDVAAMATDGGVLLIGIGEDEHEILCIPTPIALAGTREQVDQMIATNIAEPPYVEIRSIESAADPSRGYLVIVVPQSPRAPHMVTTKGHNRYYGRGETGNRRLTEGEVARLYERRQRWEVDREALLDREIRESPLASHPELGYLHIVARPVAPDDRLLGRVLEGLDAGGGPQNALHTLLAEVVRSDVLSPNAQGSPRFSGGTSSQWTRVDVGYRLGPPPESRRRAYSEAQHAVLEIQLDEDGTAHFLAGRAAGTTRDQWTSEAHRVVFEDGIAAHTARFLLLASRFLATGGYSGVVDVGLAVTGIEGAISSYLKRERYVLVDHAEPYRKRDYRRTARFAQRELETRTVDCARALTMPLFETLAQEPYDPYEALSALRS